MRDAETLLNKSSDIQQSPRKLDQQDCQPPKPEFTKLDNVQDTPDLQHISTRAQAILVHVQIRSRMSSLLITPLPLTLSEDKIHRIIKGTTYSFSNLIVKIFLRQKQLSAPKHATIATDDEMSDVASESSDTDSDDPMTQQNVDLPGVPIFHLVLPASRARFQQPGCLTYVCV